MKRIFKGVAQKIILDQANIGESKVISFSIVGENGEFLLNSDGEALEDVSLDEYAESKYQKEITISGNEKDQFIRIFFSSEEIAIEDKYFPEDVRLTAKFSSGSEIVPTTYFLDFVLNAGYKMDAAYKKAVEGFVNANREAIREKLLSAQAKLETKTGLYFAERELKIERDYYFDKFTDHLWQTTVDYPPINELIKFEIKYAGNPIAELNVDHFTFSRKTAVIEFVPAPVGDSAGLYTLIMRNLGAVTFTVFTHSNLRRVPNMFHITYKSGIIYEGSTESEKAQIRDLISRRALRELLPIVDPSTRMNSASESIDGVNMSRSYGIDKIIKTLEEEEKDVCEDIMRDYGSNLYATVV